MRFIIKIYGYRIKTKLQNKVIFKQKFKLIIETYLLNHADFIKRTRGKYVYE